MSHVSVNFINKSGKAKALLPKQSLTALKDEDGQVAKWYRPDGDTITYQISPQEFDRLEKILDPKLPFDEEGAKEEVIKRVIEKVQQDFEKNSIESLEP